MSNSDSPHNFLSDIISNVGSLTETFSTEAQKLFEQTTVSTGRALDWIASNPVLTAADNIIGLDWLMTFLGRVNTEKIRATVATMRSQYPTETSEQIAHRLIVEKTWEGGRVGLLANIIPPIAALLLGVELIATTKLQTEMVYEMAAIYDLDLEDPARRGEVLAIFALSLGADVLKTGLTIVEIIPGVGAVVGASTNAAMLYVLGQTASRFYQQNYNDADLASMQQQSNEDWQIALNQSQVMDRILAHMVQVSYPNRDWAEILPTVKEISPDSIDTIAANLKQSHDFLALLAELIPEFAPLTLSRCYDIAMSNGSITLEEQEILSQIAVKFDLDLSSVGSKNRQ